MGKETNDAGDFIIRVQGLRVNRFNARVLDGIDWTVRPGENWVILGPNGAGKTTLLSCLLAYVPPSEGTIDVLGERWGKFDWRQLRERVGLVSASLLPRIPDAEQALGVVVGGLYAQMGLRGARVTDAQRTEALAHLQRVNAAHLQDRNWGVLSQGERQRVLIARALMPKPALLIVDEPCGGLDPVARETFVQHLDGLARDKDAPSLVLVTHHIDEITPGFGHVLMLKDGRTYAAGAAEDLIDDAHLSAVFGADLQVERRGGRFHLSQVTLASATSSS